MKCGEIVKNNGIQDCGMRKDELVQGWAEIGEGAEGTACAKALGFEDTRGEECRARLERQAQRRTLQRTWGPEESLAFEMGYVWFCFEKITLTSGWKNRWKIGHRNVKWYLMSKSLAPWAEFHASLNIASDHTWGSRACSGQEPRYLGLEPGSACC